jgi:osmotically-inducible protein OsmY
LAFSDPDREQLRQRIETALHNEPSLSGTQLTVNISDNAIDLSGNTNTNKQRLAARRIVQSFAGNMRVRERITVASASPAKGSNVAETPPGTSGAVAKQREQDPNLPHTDPKKDGDKSQNPRL